MHTPVLSTKVHVPQARPGLVARPRLVERLQQGPDHCRLTLVSAPAGFGKTTLVTEWLRVPDRPVAWLSLDERDDRAARFLSYLVVALHEAGHEGGPLVQHAPQAAQQPQAEALVTALINDLAARPLPFVLVLDDYHAIRDPAIHAAIEFLLDHQPPQMHLVISTREDPPLPLPRMRGRGELAELRASDLRFTGEETAAFLSHTMGLDLAPGQVAALEAKTEGWITGLLIAALALKRIPPSQEAKRAEFVHRFSGDDRHVMDYFADEVLARQPREVQRFLLYTSILERINGPLCDALFDDGPPGESREMLERLERVNLFVVPLDSRREWYRYHRLFAELLRQRLRAEVGDEEIARLHQQANRWREREGAQGPPPAHGSGRAETDGAHRRTAPIRPARPAQANPGGALVEPLTRRECEVLALIARGYSNREIAQALVVAVSTVKRHVSNVYDKLDAHSRTRAIAQARSLGILPTG